MDEEIMPAPESAAAETPVVETRKGPAERCFRSGNFDRRAINTESRTVELAFSSEEPVERYWGREILDHSPGAMNMEFINSGRAPLLVDHDTEKQIGVVERVSIGPDRKGRATVRFGRSDDAEEIWQDVVDGIRQCVSVGYVIDEMVTDSVVGEVTTYRVLNFSPLEVSIVAIPADITVGIGRSADFKATESETIIMTTEAVDSAAGAQAERTRVSAILELSSRHGMADVAHKAIADGTSLDEFRAALLDKVGQKSLALPSSDIGMSEREVRNFSFLRAISALMNPADSAIQAAASFEREVSRAGAAKAGVEERGFYVPSDVISAPMRRDLITGTTTATSKGGNLIQTDVLGSSFIDVLRNAMVLPKVGARFMSGLQGNVAIPKRTTGVTMYWPGENTAPTEGANVFGQVTMSPKTAAAFVDIGRRLALQASVDVEALIRDDLAQALGLGIEAAALGTSATNTPTGVRGTSGIGSVAMGTNGAAPTWASICGLVKEVDIDNAMVGSAAFITNTKVKYKLSTTPKQSSGVEGNFLMGPPYSELYGFPIVFTNAIPSNLTKGSTSSACSAMLFGCWNQLLIGQWGGIQLTVDPYSLSTTGATRIVALAEVDVAVRYAEAFAAVLDYTTT